MSETQKTIEQNESPLETTKNKKNKINFSLSFLKLSRNEKNIDSLKISKYIYPITIFLMCLIVIWFMYFLYQKVYLTMADARFVISLKGDLLGEQIDKQKFEKINNFINIWQQKKEQLIDTKDLPNIFQYQQSTLTTSTESNTPTN